MEAVSIGTLNQKSITDSAYGFSDTLYDDPVLVKTNRMSMHPSDRVLESSGIYARFKDITFDTIKERGVAKQVVEPARKVWMYARDIEKHISEGHGLTLSGGVGTMKTTLAIATMRVAMEKGYKAYFIPMVSLLDMIFTLRDSQERFDFERRLRSVDLLLLDDIGAEYDQQWVLSKVDSIITERYNRKKPVILTTNLNDELLSKKYNDRIMDRLRMVNQVVIFPGESLRQSGRKLELGEGDYR